MPTLVVYTTGSQEHALSILRYRAAAQALGWHIIVGKEGTKTIFPERVHQADVVLIQRDFPRFYSAYRQLLNTARQAGKPLLYDLDDLLIALPDNHPNRRDYVDALGSILYATLTADQVIVSTPLLREIILPFQPRTTVWPTVLPDSLWAFQSPKNPNPEAPLKIGFMGSTTHMPDLDILISPIRQVVETWKQPIQLHFWGCPPPEKLSDFNQIIYHYPDVFNYTDFAAKFSHSAQADIWLAPLQPGLFNRCKSPIKFWEYSSVGGVGIYSDIDPYQSVVRHGENGLLADSQESWADAIIKLAANPDLRFRMAQNAQRDLQKIGLLSAHLQTWQHIYSTTKSLPIDYQPYSLPAQVMLQFSEQIQHRSSERHLQIAIFLQRLYERLWWHARQRFKK